jgi:Fe2+ or Zn2+ uptake regulation protein
MLLVLLKKEQKIERKLQEIYQKRCQKGGLREIKVKYEILNLLKENNYTASELVNLIDTTKNTIQVTLNRLKKENLISILDTKDNEHIYCINSNVIVNDYKVAFKELYSFFYDIASNSEDIIKNIDLWNNLWDKHEQYKILIHKLGGEKD